MSPFLPEDINGRLRDAWLRLPASMRRRLVGSLQQIYSPRCLLNCWEWAEANIILMPAESKDHAGQYRSDMTPYVRRMMEFITRPGEKEFIIRKSSQLGFTLAYMLIICYVAATRPTHTLFAIDTAEQGKKVSKRLKRLLTTNDVLKDTYTGDGEDDLKNLMLDLRGMMVMLAGSGSAGSFASNPFGLVILDELDLHQPDNKGSSTIDRGRERLKKSQDGKLIAGGKPESWNGETNKNYRTGTREQIFVPCPHCGNIQPLYFKQLRFSHCKDLAGRWDYKRVEDDTYYQCECELCATNTDHRGRINEEDKPAMLRDYQCLPTNLGQDEDKPFPGRVSMWVHDLYSVDPQNSWGQLALKWIDSQGSPTKLTAFFCGNLADPQKERGTEITRSDLTKLNGGYEYGCIPKRPAINPVTGAAAIFLTCDVQGSEKKWGKYGFTPEGEMFTIDHGKSLNFPELLAEADQPVWLGLRPPDSEKNLDALRERCLTEGKSYYESLRETYPEQEFYVVSCGLIDEGYDTFTVRDFCYSTADPQFGIPPRFYPSKGVEKVNAIEIVSEIPNRFRTGKTEDYPFITVYHYDDDALKKELYIGRIGGVDDTKEKGAKREPDQHIWFPAYCDEDFQAEFTGEKRGMMKHRGRMRMMWIKPTKDVDYGDTAKMGLGLWFKTRGIYVAPAEAPAA